MRSFLNRPALGFLFSSAALMICGSPLVAATYYVGPNGKDSNPGTEAQPYREIRKGVAKAKAGDEVLVSDGSYKGFDVREKSGTAANLIVIRAVGKKAIVTTTSDRQDNRDTIYVGFSKYVVIDGFRSSNGLRAGVRVDSCDFVTIRNCVLGNNQTWGIFTNHSDDLILEQNTCFGSKEEHGIYFSNSGDRPIIRRNKIYQNFGNGIHMNGDLSGGGGDGVIKGALVEANVIYENGVGGGSGINCDGVQDSTIRNNLVYDNHASGISLYRIDGGQSSRNNLVVNNTVVQAADARWCLNIRDGSTKNKVFNNIFINKHSFRGSVSCASDSLSGLESNRNVVDNRFTTNDGDSVMTLNQWKSQTGQDQNSLNSTLTMLFLNPGANNYQLKQTSPAVDAGGTKGAPSRDIARRRRPSGLAFDCGAYEFQVIQ